MGFSLQFVVLQLINNLIMKSLILIALSLGAAVVVNAQSQVSPPHPPPPPPPPAHYPRPPVHGYRPSYGPSHGGGLGGLGGLLPFLLLGKDGGHGKDNLLPLLLPLLLGKGKCAKPPGCVKPNTHNTLCGAGAGNTPCCVCSGHGLFGGL